MVVVPTFNERETLPILIHRLLEMPDVAVIVVDDSSPDGTGMAAERLATEFPGRVTVLRRSGRLGLGTAYVAGMELALKAGAELIVQMDGDLSHDPAHLPALTAAARTADLVIGSRYVDGGGVVNWPRRRRWLSRLANVYVRTITRLPPADCTAGYRCWRGEALVRIPLDRIRSNGYAFQVEMLWEAMGRGLRVREVPIVFLERPMGVSKLSWRVVAESVVMPWRLRFSRTSH